MKVDASNSQSKDVQQNDTVKPVQQTSIVSDTSKIRKPKNLLMFGAAGLVGIVVVLIAIVLIVGVVAAFTFGMLSNSNNGQVSDSNNGQMGTSYQAPTNSNAAAEQAALSDYNAKISITNIALNTLNSYSSNSYQYVNLDDYKSWIDGYKKYLDDYQSKANDEITAGETYKQYLTAGSDDYNTIVNNDAQINANIQTGNANYNRYLSDYNKKLATQNAANDYQNKLNTVNSAAKDLQNYVNTSGLLSSISSTWVNGYGDKVTVYSNACDQAINSGNTYQQYLDPSSQDYAQVSKNAQILTDSENQWTESYTKLKQGNEDLSSILGLVKYLPLLGA